MSAIVMTKWIHAFFNALVFLTRIPAPPGIRFTSDDLNRAAVFFPLIGLGIGATAAGIFWLADQIFSQPIAVGLSMLFSVLLTGAFHEDGLADVCDGFGGGWSRQKILEIMKDSRLGTFGSVGLFFSLGLKWLTLSELNRDLVILVLMVAHVMSRYAAVMVIGLGKPATQRAGEKQKPMANTLGLLGMLGATLLACPVLWLLPYKYWAWILGALLLITWRLYRFYLKWVQGYTGDGLGAIQQINEIVLYLIVLGVSSWNVS